MKFTLADKAYYIAEYLKELQAIDALPSRTLCEKYKHIRAGEMGLMVEPAKALAWADEVATTLHTRKSKLANL